MARPSKYTPARAAKIVEGLKVGMTRTAAAGLVDVTIDSFVRWFDRYASFAADVLSAESVAEARYTQVIAKAAFGHESSETVTVTEIIDGKPVSKTTTKTFREYDWRAAESWLKRRRKADWSERNEHTGANGGPLIDLSQARDELANLVERTHKGGATQADSLPE